MMIILIMIIIIIMSFIYPWHAVLVLVGPSKCLNQIIQIGLNRVKNPNWPEANQLGFNTRDSGLTRTNPAKGQGGTWFSFLLSMFRPSVPPLLYNA